MAQIGRFEKCVHATLRSLALLARDFGIKITTHMHELLIGSCTPFFHCQGQLIVTSTSLVEFGPYCGSGNYNFVDNYLVFFSTSSYLSCYSALSCPPFPLMKESLFGLRVMTWVCVGVLLAWFEFEETLFVVAHKSFRFPKYHFSQLSLYS